MVVYLCRSVSVPRPEGLLGPPAAGLHKTLLSGFQQFYGVLATPIRALLDGCFPAQPPRMWGNLFGLPLYIPHVRPAEGHRGTEYQVGLGFGIE